MSKLVTNDDFVENVKYLVGDEYTVVEPYITSKTPIAFLHNNCNRIWKTTPGNFKRGSRCKHCSQEKRNRDKSFTIEEILHKFNKDVGSEYTLIDRDYKNMKTKMKVRHETCGNEWYADMDSMLGKGKTRCPICAPKRIGKMRRKNSEDFIKEIYNLVGDEYSLIGEYKTAVTKVELLHNKCGSIYKVEPNSFLNGNRCKHCNRINKSSKGEIRIKEYLDSKDINYMEQYKFNDCRNKFKLPFDFAIIKDSKVSLIIEFDGRQHFEEIEIWGGSDGLIKTQINDNIKNKYCLSNNIKLIRIPHWDYDNIETILDDTFK